jgi:hypothetical protein
VSNKCNDNFVFSDPVVLEVASVALGLVAIRLEGKMDAERKGLSTNSYLEQQPQCMMLLMRMLLMLLMLFTVVHPCC